MVRTKADRVPTKAVGSKAPHKVASSTPSKTLATGSKGKNNSGGNPYHPRETPDWQKPITSFFNQAASTEISNNPSSSKGDETDGSEGEEEKKNSDE